MKLVLFRHTSYRVWLLMHQGLHQRVYYQSKLIIKLVIILSASTSTVSESRVVTTLLAPIYKIESWFDIIPLNFSYRALNLCFHLYFVGLVCNIPCI
jgi:hypothetical protein